MAFPPRAGGRPLAPSPMSAAIDAHLARRGPATPAPAPARRPWVAAGSIAVRHRDDGDRRHARPGPLLRRRRPLPQPRLRRRAVPGRRADHRRRRTRCVVRAAPAGRVPGVRRRARHGGRAGWTVGYLHYPEPTPRCCRVRARGTWPRRPVARARAVPHRRGPGGLRRRLGDARLRRRRVRRASPATPSRSAPAAGARRWSPAPCCSSFVAALGADRPPHPARRWRSSPPGSSPWPCCGPASRRPPRTMLGRRRAPADRPSCRRPS